MSNETDDLDEVRHQHHLRHRSKLDQRLSQLVWLVILVCFVARISQRTISWWRLRSYGTDILNGRCVLTISKASQTSFAPDTICLNTEIL